jgi:hypothetical protein
MSLSDAGLSTARTDAGFRLVSVDEVLALILGAAVFGSALWLPVVLGNSGTLWRITTGDWILAHWAVPALDTSSFTAFGRPWVAQEWLSEVVLALAYRAAGWNGLMVLVTGLIFVTLQHVRNAQVFGVMAPLQIANGFGPTRPAMTSEWMLGGLGGLVAVVSLFIRIGFPLQRIDEGSYATAGACQRPRGSTRRAGAE